MLENLIKCGGYVNGCIDLLLLPQIREELYALFDRFYLTVRYRICDVVGVKEPVSKVLIVFYWTLLIIYILISDIFTMSQVVLHVILLILYCNKSNI